jgi:hypothetical protein
MSLPSDVTIDNLSDFYQAILPYLNVGNGGTSDTPLGQVAFFDDLVAPAGWLVADGTVYNISDYPDLANHYNRVYGAKNHWGGNGTTTFAVPDWQGEYFRACGTNSHTGQGSGGTVGEHQDATEIPFIGTTTDDCQVFSRYGGEPQKRDSDIGSSTGRYSSAGSSFSSTSASRYTVRPTNTSLLCCVKAVPSSEMNTYSLTERRVGTWIDGKPKYAIVITGLSFGATTSAWANVTSSAIDIETSGHIETLVTSSVLRTTSSSTDCIEGISIQYKEGRLKYYTATGFDACDTLILSYTKTTD